MANPVVLIFFLSGIAALTFEALWFRLAGLSLGNSVWSASLVLAAFMGGLTLGNGLVARLHHRIARPLRLYAFLELAIGIGGFAIVLAMPLLNTWFGPLFAAMTDTPWLLNATRLGIAFAALVLPTTAMGATLPVLTDALSRSNPNFGANLGRLYGWNTLGSMLGAIGTEAVLVRWFGITSSGLIAMSLNLVAGMIALRLSHAHEPASAAPRTAQHSTLSTRTYRYLTVGLLSGATMLALEVVWFRFLLLTYTGTALTFAVMLTIVLAGIGLGGLAAGRLAQRDDHCHRWLAHVTALSGTLVVLTYFGFDLFTIQQTRANPTLPVFVGFAAFLMLPVSLLSGAAFTLVARAVQEELGESIRTTGTAALWNTVGGTAGSLGAGFLLLPSFGMERSLFILAAIYVGAALLVPSLRAGDRKWVRQSAHIAVAIGVLSLATFPFGLMQRSFFRIVERALPGETLVETREGLTETMRYYRRDVFGAPHFYRLVTNGYSMSATTAMAKRYMKLYVYLPLALKSDARDALLISFGVGSTAKALTDSGGLRHIDVVDISREILEMSAIVYTDEDNPLHDDRVTVHIEDGRFFLNTTARTYDLITSEPPPPKVAGVVNLYTQKYFQSIRDHLNPGGYTTYWLPVHQLEPLDTLAIIRAFCGAFADCSLWSGGGLEWMLMGSNEAAGGGSLETFSAQWQDARVREELVALGFELPEQMGSLFMSDAPGLAALTEGVAPITDNYPLRISDRLVRDPGRVPLYDMMMDERQRLVRFEQSAFIDRILPSELKERAVPYFHFEGMIKDRLTNGLYPHETEPFLWEAVDDVLTNSELETLSLWLLGTDREPQRIATTFAHDNRLSADVELELALGELARRDYAAALRHMQHFQSTGGALTVGNVSLLLYILAKNDMLADAHALIARLDTTTTPEIGSFLTWFEGKFPSAETARATALDGTSVRRR